MTLLLLLADESVAQTTSPQQWTDALLRNVTSPETPDELFNAALFVLGATIVALRSSHRLRPAAVERKRRDDAAPRANKAKPAGVASLQWRFLPAFWLLRIAFWMSGPYFYSAVASKTFGGVPASPALISRITLAGYCSIALFGPAMGRALDAHGRKRGTIVAAAAYALGALSMCSDSLPVLVAGRAVGGLGTNLMSSAPEAWMVSETYGSKDIGEAAGACLSETFGLAYSYDPVVAIASGQIAGFVAKHTGPTGPFMLLPIFLLGGCSIAILFWGENTAPRGNEGDKRSSMTARDGMRRIWEDKKLLALGAVQALFEGSMYIFVAQWPPAMAFAVAKSFGDEAHVPFGAVFSCFMASSMVGSTMFAKFCSNGRFLERHMTKMLVASALSMAATTYAIAEGYDLYGFILGTFAFEACVGMYFPMMGTMRSSYLPSTHRSIIMSIYAVPLNVIVITTFLFMGRIGVTGAFAVATLALATSALCMLALRRVRSREAKMNIRKISNVFKKKQFCLSMFKKAVESQRLRELEIDLRWQEHLVLRFRSALNEGKDGFSFRLPQHSIFLTANRRFSSAEVVVRETTEFQDESDDESDDESGDEFEYPMYAVRHSIR
mmetsp:Transcript_15092/g.32954  ORF Transcript_15092/g.32954 Transcript_15092/m.32954 type:complete len:610 (-) Transcript_15092:301-2130(-)